MLASPHTKRILASLLVAGMLAAIPAHAESWQDKFHRAYYLENAEGDWAAAAKLYQQVADADQADATLRAAAQARGQACNEELASADFARLMPADALAYVEISQPGERLGALLDQLGLLKTDEAAPTDEPRFAISPALIDELLGLRGAAVAVTGFDPVNQKPTGVAIIHPGNLEVVRGLIETALPVTSEPVKPIAGFPTYKVEDQVLVTLTKRLIIVSPQRGLIVNTVRRLNGEMDKSLASSEALGEILAERDGALLFFCVNAKPIMPMVNAAMAAAGTQSCELATAQAILDLNSIHSLSGRAGVNDDGLFMDFTLRLDKGHHNLVYNLLRLPPVDKDTLRCVPKGAAGFVACALNAPGAAPPPTPSEGTPVVTGLDFGRELFANIMGMAFYALPPDGTPPVGMPIPDVAAAITVKDPSKSQALWTQILGIASLASGGGAVEGATVKIAGTQVKTYRFPDGVTVYFATVDNTLLISPSQSAMARSLTARRSGASIMDDPKFAASISQIGPDSTIAMFAHPGRCAQIASQFAPPEEFAEIEPWLDTLDDTVASAVVTHSGEMFRFSATVTGIPDISELVSQLIISERQSGQTVLMVGAPQNELREQLFKLAHSENWEQGFAQIAAELPAKGSPGVGNFAKTLNNVAWELLTEDEYAGKHAELALTLSQRSNELTDFINWAYVDTLALAKFQTGDAQAAIELEKTALDLCNDRGQKPALEEALARFKAATTKQEVLAESSG